MYGPPPSMDRTLGVGEVSRALSTALEDKHAYLGIEGTGTPVAGSGWLLDAGASMGHEVSAPPSAPSATPLSQGASYLFESRAHRFKTRD